MKKVFFFKFLANKLSFSAVQFKFRANIRSVTGFCMDATAKSDQILNSSQNIVQSKNAIQLASQ